jgi:hypothetical protein
MVARAIAYSCVSTLSTALSKNEAGRPWRLGTTATTTSARVKVFSEEPPARAEELGSKAIEDVPTWRLVGEARPFDLCSQLRGWVTYPGQLLPPARHEVLDPLMAFSGPVWRAPPPSGSDRRRQGRRQLRSGPSDWRGLPKLLSVTLGRPRKLERTPSLTCPNVGGGERNRTAVEGFAGPCLDHSATPPGRCRKLTVQRRG